MKHNLLNSINGNLELANDLQWIKEKDKNFLQDLSFDIMFGYDDFERTIDKTLMKYCDNYFDKKEEYQKIIKKLQKLKDN